MIILWIEKLSSLLFHNKPREEYLTRYIGKVHQEQVQVWTAGQIRDVQQKTKVHQAHHYPVGKRTHLNECSRVRLTSY